MAAPEPEPEPDPEPQRQPEPAARIQTPTGPEPDLQRIRDLWPAAVDAVREDNGMVGAFLAAAQPAELEEETLTLAFAPDATFGKKKCEDNRALLQTALRALTGRALQIRCECREVEAGPAGGAVTLSHDELVDRLKEQFGAKEVFDEQAAPPNGDV
jgi:hypothetical protein